MSCAAREACSAGACDCEPGTLRCAGVCSDVSVSAAHCGACNTPCAAGKVCTAGSCTLPNSHWPTFQHDAAHSGENPDETGGPPLRWAWTRALKPRGAVSAPVIADGRVFVSISTDFGPASPLYAFNASDGSDLWSYNFGSVFSVGAPSVFAGSLYLANGKNFPTPPAYLWAFRADTGDIQWAAALDSGWDNYFPPLRVGDRVYADGGANGGLYAFAASDGAPRFFQSLEAADSWSPAYAAGALYTFVAGHFRRHDLTNGGALNTVDIPWNAPSPHLGTAPVLDETRAYLVAPPNLVAVDLATFGIAWQAAGTFSGTPALAGSSVFAINAGHLVARDRTTGALEWTFPGDDALSEPPIIAHGTLYVASPHHTFAIDLSTQQAVWSASVGGKLALGAHRLLIASNDGNLTAYVLTL